MHICSFTRFSGLTIEINGKSYRFDFSDQFGPALVGKRGELLQGGRAVPGQRSPFWRAFMWWSTQGYQVVEGRAVYEPRIRRERWLVVGRHQIQDTPENRSKYADFIGAEPTVIETAEDDYTSGVERADARGLSDVF